MKQFIYWAGIVFVLWSLVTAAFVRGVPYTWSINGYTVEDSTVYTGSYYQINDHLRVVVDSSTTESPRFDKYRLYELQDSHWVDINVFYFTGQFTIKGTLLFALRNKYQWQYKREQKRATRKTLFN